MQLSFKVHKPAAFIFNYLTDMQLFVTVHPIIYRISSLGNNQYKVFEKIMLGPIPISFTYRASVLSNNIQNTVTIVATVMRFTKIEMRFHIAEENGYCIVNETIDFKSLLPIRGLMQRIFKSHHTKLFDNINKLQIAGLPLQN
jgi:carbon monoxide dehydrogenase subunit G